MLHSKVEPFDARISPILDEMSVVENESIKDEDVSTDFSSECILEVEAEIVRRWSYNFLLESGAKALSAGLYLFDIISSILVLKQYYEMYSRGKYRDANHLNVGFTPFAMCLALMLSSQVGNIIAFKLRLPPEENPLRSAYFLPLIQFRRFVMGILESSNCVSQSGPSESLETEALYAFVSAGVETGPQAALQFVVMVHIGHQIGSSCMWVLSPVLLVSLIASFVSGSYNTGRAVMYQLTRRWTWKLNGIGFVAGMYTGGALLLRISTIASVSLSWNNATRNSNYALPATLKVLYYVLWLIPGSYAIGLISVSSGEKLQSWSTQLHALIAAYVNATLGPLYPVVEKYAADLDRDRSPDHEDSIGSRLALTLLLNLLLDLIPLSIIIITQLNPCNHFQYLRALGQKITNVYCLQFLAYIITGVSVTLLTSGALMCSLCRNVRRRTSS